MSQDKWDRRFFKLAEHISLWSKDPSTKCGAVITDQYNRVISLGFNGYPRSIKDHDLDNREVKYLKVLHAEQNCLIFANRNLSGCTIYTYPFAPCSQCMAAIIQSGITTIITKKASQELQERWGISNSVGFEMVEQAGITIKFLEK